mmetsp:Transcript_13357/g.46760  ORF Transcript_13357/g.46760 Transcript_13357/m.46760 type:complete len:237 (-) Transcript_13357:122-832(-)
MPFMPFSCSRIIQLRPSSWYGRIWPLMHAGCARRYSDFGGASSWTSSDSREASRVRRRDGDDGASFFRFSSRICAAATTPEPKWLKMSDCERRNWSRAVAASAWRFLRSARSWAMFASISSLKSFALDFFALVSSLSTRLTTFFLGGGSSSTARLQLRSPSATLCFLRASAWACAISASRSAESFWKRALSAAARASNLDRSVRPRHVSESSLLRCAMSPAPLLRTSCANSAAKKA